jgi:hypothetical protein
MLSKLSFTTARKHRDTLTKTQVSAENIHAHTQEKENAGNVSLSEYYVHMPSRLCALQSLSEYHMRIAFQSLVCFWHVAMCPPLLAPLSLAVLFAALAPAPAPAA